MSRFCPFFMQKDKDFLKEFCCLRIGQISLPTAVLNELKQVKRKYKIGQIKALKTKILDSLNSFQTGKPFVLPFDKDESNAYALSRMVNNYGAVSNIFNQIARKYPEFKPSTILDFGCGPGTGLFAAKAYFPIKKALLTDISEPMLQLANELCSNAYPEIEIESNKGDLYSINSVIFAFNFKENRINTMLIHINRVAKRCLQEKSC
jgi:ribosomal protein RSM22 (predicted rRNA methylase)